MQTQPGFAIHVEYDREHDAYLVYPCCHVATEDDCIAWFDTYKAAFEPLGKRIDCVIILDMFTIAKPILETWGRYRERLYDTFVRYSVRIDSDSSVLLSGMLNRRKLTRSEVASSIPEALELLEHMRARNL